MLMGIGTGMGMEMEMEMEMEMRKYSKKMGEIVSYVFGLCITRVFLNFFVSVQPSRAHSADSGSLAGTYPCPCKQHVCQKWHHTHKHTHTHIHTQ